MEVGLACNPIANRLGCHGVSASQRGVLFGRGLLEFFDGKPCGAIPHAKDRRFFPHLETSAPSGGRRSVFGAVSPLDRILPLESVRDEHATGIIRAERAGESQIALVAECCPELLGSDHQRKIHDLPMIVAQGERKLVIIGQSFALRHGIFGDRDGPRKAPDRGGWRRLCGQQRRNETKGE